MMASASAQLVGSPTVGPEAMSRGSSPGTSEISSVTTRAGWHSAPSRPPLSADRWRRTQFISEIVAPLASSAVLTARLSSSVRPGAGATSSDEPPPEISAITRSSALRPVTFAAMRREAARPAASGTGCAACTISMRSHGTS